MKRLMRLVALVIPLLVQASQRVVVFEDFTATWCTYCPGAARGIDELDGRAFDSVVSIAYHSSSSDPYYNAYSAARASYYGLRGYPTVRMDGKVDSVVGGVHTGTMYPTYRQLFDQRKTVASPLEIEASCSYDSLANSGQLRVVIHNPTSSPVTGQLQCVLVENHIYYPWQGMDSLHFVVRLMLPDANGEAVTIPANDSLVRTRDFSLTTGIVPGNCEIVVFVQNNSNQQMIQAARTGVIMRPRLVYAGYQRIFPGPGTDVQLTPALLNLGTGLGQGIIGTLGTSDPYVTVTAGTMSFPDIAVGATAYSTAPFELRIAPGCPSPHLATLDLLVTAENGYVTNLSLPLNITRNPGYADSMESGNNNWAHHGILDNWHQTTHRSTSPSHSWYCGIENSWQYGNENDAHLVTPYFTVADNAQLTFRHFHSTEADYDFCLVELDNGGDRWAQLASYDGPGSSWEPAQFDLSAWAGQTVRIRFRFISDNSVVAEGWYIDDFWCTPITGVQEQPGVPSLALQLGMGLTRGPVAIHYCLPPGLTGELAVYDAAGRLVRHLNPRLTGTGDCLWDLTDDPGSRAPSGAYIVRLESASGFRTSRVVVVRTR